MNYTKLLQKISKDVYEKIEEIFNENNVKGELTLKCDEFPQGMDYDYCKSLFYEFDLTDLSMIKIVRPHTDTDGLLVYFNDDNALWLDEFDTSALVRFYNNLKEIYEPDTERDLVDETETLR